MKTNAKNSKKRLLPDRSVERTTICEGATRNQPVIESAIPTGLARLVSPGLSALPALLLLLAAPWAWCNPTSQYEIIHAVGDPAPDGANGTFDSFFGEHISRQGNLVYQATVNRVGGDFVNTIYRRVNGIDDLVYFSNQPAPGRPDTTIFFARLLGASDGDIEVLVGGNLAGPFVTADDDSALFLFGNSSGAGQLQPVAWEGQIVTVASQPVTLDDPTTAALSRNEHVVFYDQRNRMFFDGEANTIPSARLYPGLPLPGIMPNARLNRNFIVNGWNGRINYLGQIALVIRVEVVDEMNNVTDSFDSVVVSSKSGVREVYRIGRATPGFPEGENILEVDVFSLAINDAGRVAFLATMLNAQTVLLKEEGGGTLKEVIRVGESVPLSNEESMQGFTINWINPNNVCLNTTGEVTIAATIEDSANPFPNFFSALITETGGGLRTVLRQSGPLQTLPDQNWEVLAEDYVQALEDGSLAVQLTALDGNGFTRRLQCLERARRLYQPFPVLCPVQGGRPPFPYPANDVGSRFGWNNIISNYTGGQDGQRHFSTHDGSRMVAVIDGAAPGTQSALVVINNQAPPEPPAGLQVLGVTRTGNTFVFTFVSNPGLAGFEVRGSTNLADGFTIDKTADSTISELQPGLYQALIDVTGEGPRFFVQIRQP